MKKKCACCGKELYIPIYEADCYVYKKKKVSKTLWYCSWTCYRSNERKKDYYTLAELEKKWGMPYTSLIYMCKNGKLPYKKLKGRIVVMKKDAMTFYLNY